MPTPRRQLLPTNVKPTNYRIELWPDLEQTDYEGRVDIALDVLRDSYQVSFHAPDIILHSVQLEGVARDQHQSPRTITYDDKSQVVTASFAKRLLAGSRAMLNITFRAKFNDGSFGFYKKPYQHDGITKYLACTQFQPCDARRTFPCMDEPALKATFDVVIHAAENITCLSNMNVVSVDTDGHTNTVTFARTPLMSTYIVAFVVSELEYVETNDYRVPIRTYTTPGKKEKGRYAAELAVKTLKFYDEAFGAPYPLPKMDQIAVPDFGGAMENWGCVIYRESALLLNDEESAATQKIKMDSIVQHELAHQWFGDYVTMQYWDALWLNEGFATWMSYYSYNVIYPERKIWQAFLGENQAAALQLDSLRNSHPVEFPVSSVGDIGQVFNAISYSKGSSLIQMIASYLGEDVFMAGIRLYMKKHAYSNTESNDLWNALAEASSGIRVSEIMKIWTNKIGYPVLTVTETDHGIRVKQNRFLQTGDATPSEDETIYPVLITLQSNAKTQHVLLNQRSLDIKLKNLEYLKLNAGQSGVYRVLYTPERLNKLGRAMGSGKISAEDSIGIIADATALSSAGFQRTSALLGLLSRLKLEKNSYVWKTIQQATESLEQTWKLESAVVRDALKRFVKELFSPEAEAIGWEFGPDDDVVLQEHKTLMFGTAGLAGNEKIISAAKKMFEARYYHGDKTALHPNLRAPVHAIMISHFGGMRDFEIMRDVFRNSTDAGECEDAISCMGYFQDLAIINLTLQFILSDEVKDQDAMLPFPALIRSAASSLHIWRWCISHFDALLAKISNHLGVGGKAVQLLVNCLPTTEHRADVEAFFAQRDTTTYHRVLAQALDEQQARIKWLERDRQDVESWLDEWQNGEGGRVWRIELAWEDM